MSTQADALVREIESLAHVFDFDRDGLGESLVESTAYAILGQMAEEIDPDGAPWAPLSELYAEMKSFYYPGQPISVLEGHMRTFEQIKGMYRVSTDSIGQTYGIDEVARELASWFQEGNANQPPRPFYAFNVTAEARLGEILDRRFAAMTR